MDADQHDISYTYSGHNIGVCYALNSAAQLAATDQIVYLMICMSAWLGFAFERRNKSYNRIYYILFLPRNRGFSSKQFVVSGEIMVRRLKRLMNINYWQNINHCPKPTGPGATWPPNLVHKQIWDLVGGYGTEFSPAFILIPILAHETLEYGRAKIYRRGGFPECIIWISIDPRTLSE